MLLLKQAWDSTMFKQLPENSCFYTHYPWNHFPRDINFTKNPDDQTIFIGIDSYLNAGKENNLVISSIEDLNIGTECSSNKNKLNALLKNPYTVKKDDSIEHHTILLIKALSYDFNPRPIEVWRKILCGIETRYIFCPGYGLLHGLKQNDFYHLVSYVFNTNRIFFCYYYNFFIPYLQKVKGGIFL